jgi:hypothetical protein
MERAEEYRRNSFHDHSDTSRSSAFPQSSWRWSSCSPDASYRGAPADADAQPRHDPSDPASPCPSLDEACGPRPPSPLRPATSDSDSDALPLPSYQPSLLLLRRAAHPPPVAWAHAAAPHPLHPGLPPPALADPAEDHPGPASPAPHDPGAHWAVSPGVGGGTAWVGGGGGLEELLGGDSEEVWLGLGPEPGRAECPWPDDAWAAAAAPTPCAAAADAEAEAARWGGGDEWGACGGVCGGACGGACGAAWADPDPGAGAAAAAWACSQASTCRPSPEGPAPAAAAAFGGPGLDLGPPARPAAAALNFYAVVGGLLAAGRGDAGRRGLFDQSCRGRESPRGGGCGSSWEDCFPP